MSDIQLTIEGDGISFKKTISQHRAGQIIALLGVEQSPVIDPVFKAPQIKSSTSNSSGKIVRGVRDEVSNLPIDASLENYPGFYDLPLKADKILWLLEYAEQHGIAELSSAEVDFLSKQLRERVDTKNFGAFNQRNVRSGYVSKIKGLFQIQRKGKLYLAGLKK